MAAALIVHRMAAPIASRVLASRSEPPLPLHRWRVEDRLAEIRNTELAFDDDDAAALLAGLGAAVDRDAVSLLTRRTEGWAAGLQLAGLSVRDRDDAADYLLDFASTDRNLTDYLTAEVLHQQPDDVTDFLLATSVLRDLDARVCRAITGHHDARERLRDIEARGCFSYRSTAIASATATTSCSRSYCRQSSAPRRATRTRPARDSFGLVRQRGRPRPRGVSRSPRSDDYARRHAAS